MSNLSVRTLINIAHESAKENFGREEFNFPALWAKTWSRAKDFKKESIEHWIGAFYTELLIDPRFILVGSKRWKLREFMDYSEYLKITGKRAKDVTFTMLEESEGEAGKKVEKAEEKVEEQSFETVGEKVKDEEIIEEDLESEEDDGEGSDVKEGDDEDSYE